MNPYIRMIDELIGRRRMLQTVRAATEQNERALGITRMRKGPISDFVGAKPLMVSGGLPIRRAQAAVALCQQAAATDMPVVILGLDQFLYKVLDKAKEIQHKLFYCQLFPLYQPFDGLNVQQCWELINNDADKPLPAALLYLLQAGYQYCSIHGIEFSLDVFEKSVGEWLSTIDRETAKKKLTAAQAAELRRLLVAAGSTEVECARLKLAAATRPLCKRGKDHGYSLSTASKWFQVIGVELPPTRELMGILVRDLMNLSKKKRFHLILYDVPIAGNNEELERFIVGGNCNPTLIGADVPAMIGYNEQLYKSVAGRMDGFIAMQHNRAASCELMSRLFGEYQMHDLHPTESLTEYSLPYLKAGPFMRGTAYTQSLSSTVRMEPRVRADELRTLGEDEGYVMHCDSRSTQIARTTFV